MALAIQRTAVRPQAQARPARRSALVVRAASASAGEVPTPEKRTTLNLLLAGAIGLPVAGLAGPL